MIKKLPGARPWIVAVFAVAILTAIGGWVAMDTAAHAQSGLPAPANVQVVNGANPGEVVVSWDEVAGASGYTVRLGQPTTQPGTPITPATTG